MIPNKKTDSYLAKANKRLTHIRSHIDDPEDVAHSINNIRNKVGNLPACVMSLSSHAVGTALCKWFEDRQLNEFKQWCYISAKLDQLWYQIADPPFSPRANMLGLLKPLLSDENEVIDWFTYYDKAYDLKRVDDHKTHDFFAYQSIVALQGDWCRLLTRCDIVLNDPPGASKEQKYLLDHHFYRALAKGDVEKMQTALQKLLSFDVLRAREDDESGFTKDLIFTPAVIYAKIARRHGYEIILDSPYVPTEWLPVEPLRQYDYFYDFLRN